MAISGQFLVTAVRPGLRAGGRPSVLAQLHIASPPDQPARSQINRPALAGVLGHEPALLEEGFMRPNSRMSGLAAIACVTACAALLLPAAASGAARRPTAARVTAPECATPAIEAWAAPPGSVTMGKSYNEIELSNVSARSCTLDGYPVVRAVSGRDARLGSAPLRMRVEQPGRVTLRPDETAHFILVIADVTDYPPSSCEPVEASGLRIYLSDDTRPVRINFPFEACKKSGHKYLGVFPVARMAGYPGIKF